MNTDTKIQSHLSKNIIKFPGSDNKAVDEQTKEFAKLLVSIAAKMNKPNWELQTISPKELLLLSNHGEAIEHPPISGSRLISVLASSLIRNSFMEDLIWEKIEKAIAA